MLDARTKAFSSLVSHRENEARRKFSIARTRGRKLGILCVEKQTLRYGRRKEMDNTIPTYVLKPEIDLGVYDFLIC